MGIPYRQSREKGRGEEMESTESAKTEKDMTNTEDDTKQRKEKANKQIWKKIDTETIILGATLQKNRQIRGETSVLY